MEVHTFLNESHYKADLAKHMVLIMHSSGLTRTSAISIIECPREKGECGDQAIDKRYLLLIRRREVDGHHTRRGLGTRGSPMQASQSDRAALCSAGVQDGSRGQRKWNYANPVRPLP